MGKSRDVSPVGSAQAGRHMFSLRDAPAAREHCASKHLSYFNPLSHILVLRQAQDERSHDCGDPSCARKVPPLGFAPAAPGGPNPLDSRGREARHVPCAGGARRSTARGTDSSPCHQLHQLMNILAKRPGASEAIAQQALAGIGVRAGRPTGGYSDRIDGDGPRRAAFARPAPPPKARFIAVSRGGVPWLPPRP